jgi:hypothetical protein
VVIAVMAEVIVNEAGMKEEKTKRKVASRTRVRADISTERLDCGHTRELKERTVTRDIALNNREV